MKKPVSVCNAKAIKQTTFHACHICVESLYWGGELQCNDGGGGSFRLGWHQREALKRQALLVIISNSPLRTFSLVPQKSLTKLTYIIIFILFVVSE